MTPPPLLLTALDLVVKNLGTIPLDAQQITSKIASTIAPSFWGFSHAEITFERHPLQTLHHLLQRTLETGQYLDLRSNLNNLPENVRKEIYYEVWSLATDEIKGGDSWGEQNALNNLPRLLHSIKTVAEKRLDALPSEERNRVFGTIYRMANQPEVGDHEWGEHNAKTDTERLIRALHRNHALDLSGVSIPYLSEPEKEVIVPSHNFHLHRPELTQGQICMINGMTCLYANARDNALKLSDDLAQGYNIHFTYSATVNPHWDIASGILGQGGTITPAVLHLLNQWLDYFETHDDGRLLQIGMSRGCIEINNALHLLPAHLRQRIIVVAVAPASLLSHEIAYKVINLIILTDPVLSIAANRQLINAPHTIQLNPHNNTSNQHDMFGSSYAEELARLLNTYIRTNDIG